MTNVLIIHGTEGHPGENWFPWMKAELEKLGCDVVVPQFPSPPVVPAKMSEWFNVLTQYEDLLDENAIIIGHSLGGLFALRVLEQCKKPIKAAVFVGASIGVKPIRYYDRDLAFSGFDFDWQTIRDNAEQFLVFHSDDDPYVDTKNGQQLAERLGVELTLVSGAGHFNEAAGYVEFHQLLEALQAQGLVS